jgi:hypothetical protein
MTNSTATAAPSAFALRAARNYLAAWERQGGVSRPFACSLVHNANLLGKVALSADSNGGITLDSFGGHWWGEAFRLYALRLLGVEA